MFLSLATDPLASKERTSHESGWVRSEYYCCALGSGVVSLLFRILREHKAFTRPSCQPKYMSTRTVAPEGSFYRYNYSLKRYVPEERVRHTWKEGGTYDTASRRRISLASSSPYKHPRETCDRDTRYSMVKRPTVPSSDDFTGGSRSKGEYCTQMQRDQPD